MSDKPLLPPLSDNSQANKRIGGQFDDSRIDSKPKSLTPPSEKIEVSTDGLDEDFDYQLDVQTAVNIILETVKGTNRNASLGVNAMSRTGVKVIIDKIDLSINDLFWLQLRFVVASFFVGVIVSAILFIIVQTGTLLLMCLSWLTETIKAF